MGWTGEAGYFERRTPSGELKLLSYFSEQRREEFLRAETDNCADPSSCKGLKVKVSQDRLGAPLNRAIIQIVYTFAGETGAKQTAQPYWKSILIESGPGRYRELLLLKNEGGFWTWPPSTARILSAGTTKVLVTSDQTTSRDLYCTGQFWVLDKSGASIADFSGVLSAIQKALPTGTQNVTPMCDAVHLEALRVVADIQKVNPDSGNIGIEGHVVVKFRFDGARAVPVSAAFRQETEESN